MGCHQLKELERGQALQLVDLDVLVSMVLLVFEVVYQLLPEIAHC